MNDSAGVEQTLPSKKANFHKTCRVQFNTTELKRANKRKTTVSDDNASCDAHGRFICQKMFRPDHADVVTSVSFVTYLQPEAIISMKLQRLTFERLMAKLSEGDLISIEGKYHGHCLTSLYNRDIYRSKHITRR